MEAGLGLFDVLSRWTGRRRTSAQAIAHQSDPLESVPPPFPYPLVTVRGSEAMATWAQLRARGGGWPVIIGADEDVDFIREGIEEIEKRRPEEIVASADALAFPQSLAEMRADDLRSAIEYLRARGHEAEEDEETEPPIGDWPDQVETTGLTVSSDYTGKPHDRVHIALLPCETGWEAIAHLRWGNWNENPSAEYHVAALRSWGERYGAELVGCSHDTINLRVIRCPDNREEALALAREHYLYCNDIIDQGTGTLASFAAVLMASEWWYFWWD